MDKENIKPPVSTLVLECLCVPEDGEKEGEDALTKARQQARIKFNEDFQADLQRLIDHFEVNIQNLKHLERCPTCPKKN